MTEKRWKMQQNKKVSYGMDAIFSFDDTVLPVVEYRMEQNSTEFYQGPKIVFITIRVPMSEIAIDEIAMDGVPNDPTQTHPTAHPTAFVSAAACNLCNDSQ